ncbi:cytochrome b5 [Chaetoceros tenuissimus]|uniref:Cytochrome b5 n=1 Tax=Chaetoceros tenuissimus TaxID=426638 RepID=A0AAD3CSC0_9STRA|nr:cytochrome b5 [Chaetoceros tenuissimus]
MNKKADQHTKERGEALHLSIDGIVYDVTKYQYEHPGGRIAFQLQKDKDCTDLFHAVGHSKHAMKLLQKYRIRKGTSNIAAPQILQETRHYKTKQSRRKLFVFILSMVATSTTIYSYWNLICNKNAASTLDTLADLMYEIMTSIYVPTQLLVGSFMVADYILVDDCRANFQLLKQAGYSMAYVLFCMLSIYVVSAPALGLIFWTFLQDSQPHFDVTMVPKILITYVMADMLFENVHKWMHHKKTNWHLMHHVAVFPTACSAFVFDLTDYALEFWAAKFPIILILGTDVVKMYDGFACVLCMAMAILIDICNHDAWCRTRHYYHHVSTASSFGIVPFEMSTMSSTKSKGKDSFNHPLRRELESALLGGRSVI